MKSNEETYIRYKHVDYMNFAKFALNDWHKLHIELNELIDIENNDEEKRREIYKTNRQQIHYLVSKQRMCIDNCIVYSALFLESFINFYGVMHQIPNIKHFETSLTIRNKWRIYPNIAVGKQISGAAIKTLGDIFTKRDDIVHYKPSTTAKEEDDFSLIDGINLFNKVNFVRKELGKIDKKFPWNGKDLSIPEDIPARTINISQMVALQKTPKNGNASEKNCGAKIRFVPNF